VKREPGKPVLNLDFLLETVVQRVIPLDWAKCVLHACFLPRSSLSLLSLSLFFFF
jgi:hypothetical protein